MVDPAVPPHHRTCRRLLATGTALLLVVTACSGGGIPSSPSSTTTTAANATTATAASATTAPGSTALSRVVCHEEDREGCTALGITLAQPVDLAVADGLVREFGGRFVGAWMTDWVCLPGYGQYPLTEPEARRFGFRNGPARARAVAEAYIAAVGPPVAHWNAYHPWLLIEQAGLALREPGTLVAAIEVLAPSDRVPAIAADERYRLVLEIDGRWGFPAEPGTFVAAPSGNAVLLDLDDAAEPECLPIGDDGTVALPPSAEWFFGRVVTVEFSSEWRLVPDDVAVSVGPPRTDTTLGPATLRFDDGRTLHVPPNTPGGNNCRELIRDEDWPGITGFEYPTERQKELYGPAGSCVLYGGLDGNGEVAWFSIARYREGDSVAVAGEIVALNSGVAVLAGGVELPIAPEEDVEIVLGGETIALPADGHVACSGAIGFAEWWPDDSPHVTYIDVGTGEIVGVSCLGFF